MVAKITLEMWRMFVAIATDGSSQKAAITLCKSQSAVSHALKKMEGELGNPLFELSGRHLVLTTLGKILLPKAQRLLGEASGLETLGKNYQTGFLDEIAFSSDVLLPSELLHEVIERFQLVYPDVSLRIFEPSLSGTSQLLKEGVIALGISSMMPSDCIVEPLFDVHKTCVCSSEHPLAALSEISQSELKKHTHIVIRDSGQQNINSGWLGSTKRITVSQINTAFELVKRGVGYAWLPDELTQILRGTNKLANVNLNKGAKRVVRLQIGMLPDLASLQEVVDLYDIFRAVAKSLSS
jgi:DNA-binding transcriptional LysR family regulator